jgi:WD40 repeat protein
MKTYFLSHFVLLMLIMVFFTGCNQYEASVEEAKHTAVGTLDAVISNDAKFAVVSSVNHGTGFWDLEKNELLFNWDHGPDPEREIIATNISPDTTRAITADSRNFSIWNTNSGKSYGFWRAPAKIRAVALSNKGRYVLLGLEDGRAIHIDMNTGRRLEFTGHREEAVADVDLSANGRWAFTGGADYRAVLWNTKTGKPKRLFEHSTRVTLLKLSRSGQLAFTAGTKGNAFIWDLTTGQQISKLALAEREYIITSAQFSHDDKRLVTGAPARDISLWRIDNGKRVKRWQARTREQWKPSGAIIYAVAFSPNDRYILSESSAGFGEKWSIKSISQ